MWRLAALLMFETWYQHDLRRGYFNDLHGRAFWWALRIAWWDRPPRLRLTSDGGS